MVGSDVFTFVPHGDTIQTLFKSREVNGKVMAIRSMGDSFGFPEKDLSRYDADDSGTLPTPAQGFEDWPPEKRFWFLNHRAMHSLLQGPVLVDMLGHFIEKYARRVEEKEIGYDEWTTVDDLYGMMKNDLFYAAMSALCGDHFFELSPTMAEDFWEFDRCLPTIFKKVPRWLVPKAYASRDKVLANIDRYLDYADEHFDWTNQDLANCNWEPIYGAKLMRVRHQLFRQVGQSREADPAAELGLIWA